MPLIQPYIQLVNVFDALLQAALVAVLRIAKVSAAAGRLVVHKGERAVCTRRTSSGAEEAQKAPIKR